MERLYKQEPPEPLIHTHNSGGKNGKGMPPVRHTESMSQYAKHKIRNYKEDKDMKKILFTLITACTFATGMQAQEIYKEVKNLQGKVEAIVNDSTKDMETRKVACFKYDAIYYLIDKASREERFTEYELGAQTNAMIDFVNLYVKRLGMEKKQKDKDLVKAKFRTATINNSLFNDTDKEVAYAYVDNEKYITQFPLDTDWVKALNEVR